MIPLP